MVKVVGIIGTGDYGRALAKRLLRCGYDVIMGSRYPDHTRLTQIDERLAYVKVKSRKELLEDSNIEIVFLAIHASNFESSLSSFRNQIQDKIFIDISNRERLSKTESNAEKLLHAFPGLRVVKAFNTLSAYALESDTFGGAKQVLIASDDTTAREKVSSLAREMGFTPVDYGVLSASREIEAYPLTFMVGWSCPTLFVFFLFLFWILICIYNRYRNDKKSSSHFTWDNIPLNFVNEPVALTAITLLSVSYLPGCLAAFMQMANGTKYRRFPNWFDQWLKSRKMLGLYALFFSVFHAMISGINISPGFMKWWYTGNHIQLPHNASDFQFTIIARMNFKGELTILIGIVALLLMSLLGLSSLPSVGSLMNWREWRFVQSHLGYVTLFLVTIHVCFPVFSVWLKDSISFMTNANFLACLLPALVLLMKLILIIPCISHYVDKVRSGWERTPPYQILSEVNNEV